MTGISHPGTMQASYTRSSSLVLSVEKCRQPRSASRSIKIRIPVSRNTRDAFKFQRRLWICKSSPDDAGGEAAAEEKQEEESKEDPVTRTTSGRTRRRSPDSTDAIASALTRRFGLAGGLAWIAFLSLGVVGEQIKTRLEVASEEKNTKNVSEDDRVVEKIPGTGITYYDIVRGGGARPMRGDLVVLNMKGYANGSLFVDTSDTGKPIVFLYKGRPFTAGMCLGLEMALESMQAGGKRFVTVPSEYGFGEEGISLKPTLHVPEKQGIVPPGADLTYEVELVRVSIPPS